MIREGVFDHESVVALIDRHNEFCLAETSPCKAHRLDLRALAAPEIRFWTIWQGDEAIGSIALRDLGAGRGEVKSMHVLEAHRGSDVADQLFAHLMEAARAMGMHWLGLETGETANFDRAVRFYQKRGFETCAAFGDYTPENAGRLMARRI